MSKVIHFTLVSRTVLPTLAHSEPRRRHCAQ